MQSGCATVCCREYGDDLAFARIADGAMIVTENLLYTERVSSKRTEMLFIALMLLFFTLLIWRVTARGLDILLLVFLCLFAFFFFYALNYRTLTIRLATRSLKLTFGIFTWNVSLENIESCRLDEIPVLMRMGGAGIHFILIRRRYSASPSWLL
jgi:hypothetical protein